MVVRSCRVVIPIAVAGWLSFASACFGEDVLFEDNFDKGLSDKWQAVGLDENDYRVRDGALEIRLRPGKASQPQPMLKVDLPFGTADSVVASVDVSVEYETLNRGERAGVSLNDREGISFTGRVTNNDGYIVLAPGQVDFIGKPGEEGNPGKYTVKYWPADKEFGPLRILVRGHYAHFQVGPSKDGKYQTFFHSALRQSNEGLGFGLFAVGVTEDADRWVRFDNFQVNKH
ncbi:MAG: hypothetical protein U0795_03405 [Pirellulales bacterium]